MCTFVKISKEDFKKSMSYVIATAILNMKNEFTIDEICNIISEKFNLESTKKLDVKNTAIEKLFMLRDNGVVIEHGSYFSVKEQMA